MIESCAGMRDLRGHREADSWLSVDQRVHGNKPETDGRTVGRLNGLLEANSGTLKLRFGVFHADIVAL